MSCSYRCWLQTDNVARPIAILIFNYLLYMKRLACILLYFLMIPALFAQIDPVKWSYTAKKTSPGIYELHFKAMIDAPWHIYSQFTPEGGPNPTIILLNKNPLVSPSGKAKEMGKLKQKHEEVFKVDVKYFDGKVDFVQVVKVKGNIKTNIGGTISYMICNDEMCLPPKTEKFSFQLN